MINIAIEHGNLWWEYFVGIYGGFLWESMVDSWELRVVSWEFMGFYGGFQWNLWQFPWD